MFFVSNFIGDTGWDTILTEIDSGNTPAIHCFVLEDEVLTKVAGLGCPVYVHVPTDQMKVVYDTIESLNDHLVDTFIVYDCNADTYSDLYEFLGDVLTDPRLLNVKVVLNMDGQNARDKQYYWENAFIFCEDHGIDIHSPLMG